MPSTRSHTAESLTLSFALVAYLILCVIYGGAGREGYFAHGLLQASAAIGVAILVVSWPIDRSFEMFRMPIILMLMFAALCALHLIPLPSEIWRLLPGRALVQDGYEQLSMDPPMLSLSLDAEATMMTIGYVLTPMFTFVVCARIGVRKIRKFIPWVIVLLGASSVALGGLQVLDGPDSNWYQYEYTIRDRPVGFFSNVNHQASLLLMSIPFAFFLLNEQRKDPKKSDLGLGILVVLVAVLTLLLFGVLVAGSLAGYGIVLPVVALSIFFMRETKAKPIGQSTKFSVLFVMALGALFIAASPWFVSLQNSAPDVGDTSRAEIWRLTLNAISDHWVLGTGLGSYESVIPMYEDPQKVSGTWIAKAHNDYLQIILEAGLIGVAIICVAIGWLIKMTWSITSSSKVGSTASLRKFAIISLIAVSLHSIVDYPARTPAIAALLGICLALACEHDTRPNNLRVRTSEHAHNPKRRVL